MAIIGPVEDSLFLANFSARPVGPLPTKLETLAAYRLLTYKLSNQTCLCGLEA